MTSDAFQDPKRDRRRDSEADRRVRRPSAGAGASTRERMGGTRLRKPGRKTLYWTGGTFAVLALAIAVLIAVWDWNWFRGPVARLASARMHREVAIDGDLDVHLWSWQPSATVEKVRIANPKWAGKGPMADIDRIAIQIRLLPLFGGHLDMRLLRFDRPQVWLYRDARGRATWDFSDGKKKEQPLRLPPIRSFIIHDGHLKFRDVRRKLNFTGTVNASEQQGAAIRGFEMTGAGALNNNPFQLSVTGGPLLNIDRNRPYPFDARIRSGATYVTAKGAVDKPFDLGHFYMNTTARGPDLEALYDLTGVPLPDTPPYTLHGRLSRDLQLYKITGLGGRVGSSDLTGQLSVDSSGQRPFLKADLRTRSLDFRDLGAIFGGTPAPGKVASPAQKAAAQVLKAEQRILPDATLKVDRIRAMDANVIYVASSIHDAPMKLTSGSVRVKLDRGLLTADPVSLELPQGRLAGTVALNARNATPATDLDLRLSNARLEQVIPVTVGGSPPFDGALVGRARLHGVGDSVHKTFASANGEVMVVVPGGEIRESFAELTGIDVIKGLGLLLSHNKVTTPIRCGVGYFRSVNGVLTADQLVIDTDPVLIKGSGSIDMRQERIAFRLQGQPKKFRLVRLTAPITVEGPILHPHVGVQAGGAIAQGGIAAALGVLVSPLAVLLPFVDPGLAKNANCAAIIAEGAQHGAPAKGAAQVAAKR